LLPVAAVELDIVTPCIRLLLLVLIVLRSDMVRSIVG
jgi:hypothetical protein